ncbi:ATP-binding protein [Piscinibacter sp. HJYY11]|uniref:ATP-binding protein n=1 Tax=Piscinibacter sp. HJYY11 TaxID=2801333 RepID=UPI00191E75E6|nr:ATP-binding protein [Piscinibacter sp. HJYY11]MBL0727654.1 Hpt domain-containing protein [Piscinibacter sp. HJYY11]
MLFRLILLTAALLGLLPSAFAAESACQACGVQVTTLAQPLKLAGTWLFTRDDKPQNKDVGLDTSDWKLAKAPGPWKHIYGDKQNFSVGWYRGSLHFAPELVGREVVLLVNTYMARTQVFVNGQLIYARPHDINVERYHSIQPIPVRFKITQPEQVVAIRVDTPLMTGIYQLPLEIHAYDQHDASLVAHQVWGGEMRTIISYVVLTFGLFFLLVYAKTRHSMYLVAAMASILIFPFFAAPGDYFLQIFQPETMLYWHYTGLSAIFVFYLFTQYVHVFTPKLNWFFGITQTLLALGCGAQMFFPDLTLFQGMRSALFIESLVIGVLSLYMTVRGAMKQRPGARPLAFGLLVFLVTGTNDVLLALGVISSMAVIFTGVATFVAAMLYVACMRFANTFLENKKLLTDVQALNDNLEALVAERTQQLHEKTHDIHAMLQNMPQGVLTITGDNAIHPEYSAYLETIFETKDIAGRNVMALVFAGSNLGADRLSQVEAAAASCIGEDRMNFDFNSHLLVPEFEKTLPDGRLKSLALSWSPICDEHDTVEKLMLCVRDVTELKRLEHEASAQKRELEIIGEILAVSQEKFHEFVGGALKFCADNKRLIEQAAPRSAETVNLLFRNMHTVKGNARTYGLLYLTNLVHETEQAYDDLRKGKAEWNGEALLAQLAEVQAMLEEYARINDHVLGRQGPGRRGSVEKFVMVDKAQVQQSLGLLVNVDQNDPAAMRAVLAQLGRTLNLIGTERIGETLAGPIESLPSLARELGKEVPVVHIEDHGIVLRTQVGGLLKNVFSHLLRNAVDHGLEPTAERLSWGKPAAGRIDIALSVDDGKLHIHLRDDGRGMAIARIRERALEWGLIAAGDQHTPEEIAQVIFHSGFSTAERVTEVSGRGVGMDAVKGFLEKEGGSIEIRFTGDEVRGHRPFELVLSLPDKYAASLDAALSFDALRQRLASASLAAR